MEKIKFTKNQVNTLFGSAKRGEIKIEKWIITRLYDSVKESEYYVSPYSDFKDENEMVKNVVNAIFNKDFENAQKEIKNYMDKFNFNTKLMKKVDRTLIA